MGKNEKQHRFGMKFVKQVQVENLDSTIETA
jgi:hypothetical protein